MNPWSLNLGNLQYTNHKPQSKGLISVEGLGFTGLTFRALGSAFVAKRVGLIQNVVTADPNSLNSEQHKYLNPKTRNPKH